MPRPSSTGGDFCAPARLPAFLSSTLCAEMPLLQSREKPSVTLSQKRHSVLCKVFLRIDTSRPFPVNKYSPNICTCKCNVSWLCRNANLSPYRNEKKKKSISECLRLFPLVLFLPHPKGNLVPFADDGPLSFSQSPIALAPVFPSSPPLRPGNRLENAILKDVSIAKVHLDEKGATDACRGIARGRTGVARFLAFVRHINMV